LREAALANAERNVQFAEEDMGDFLDIIACNGDSDGWWE
jgi:hypothetical protein